MQTAGAMCIVSAKQSRHKRHPTANTLRSGPTDKPGKRLPVSPTCELKLAYRELKSDTHWWNWRCYLSVSLVRLAASHPVSGPKPPGQNPPRTEYPPGKNILGQNPSSLPLNQMQPLVCNAVVLKVRIMYVHEPLGRNASVNESMYWWHCKGTLKLDFPRFNVKLCFLIV